MQQPPAPSATSMNWFGPVAEGFAAGMILFSLVGSHGLDRMGRKGMTEQRQTDWCRCLRCSLLPALKTGTIACPVLLETCWRSPPGRTDEAKAALCGGTRRAILRPEGATGPRTTNSSSGCRYRRRASGGGRSFVTLRFYRWYCFGHWHLFTSTGPTPTMSPCLGETLALCCGGLGFSLIVVGPLADAAVRKRPRRANRWRRVRPSGKGLLADFQPG